MSENFFKDSDRNDARLCFWLGFVFPFLGLILAAIVGKGDGVRAALRGFALAILLLAGVAILRGAFDSGTTAAIRRAQQSQSGNAE